jgi:hypothetical protein
MCSAVLAPHTIRPPRFRNSRKLLHPMLCLSLFPSTAGLPLCLRRTPRQAPRQGFARGSESPSPHTECRSSGTVLRFCPVHDPSVVPVPPFLAPDWAIRHAPSGIPTFRKHLLVASRTAALIVTDSHLTARRKQSAVRRGIEEYCAHLPPSFRSIASSPARAARRSSHACCILAVHNLGSSAG